MTLWLSAAYGVLGAVIGSFLNVCIDRLPSGQSIVHPGSHCPACNRPLGPLEMIPIVSYVVLGGRCRTCRTAIGWRSPVVELITGILFGLIFLRYGWTLTTLLFSIDASFLIVMAFTDLERHRILNVVVFPAIGLAALAALFTPGRSTLQLLLGGALAFSVLFLLAVLVPGGMGMGDVKLATFIGLIVGFPQIGAVLLLSFVLGGAIAGGLWLGGVFSRGDKIAFGPYLAAGALIGMLYGDRLISLWLGRTS